MGKRIDEEKLREMVAQNMKVSEIAGKLGASVAGVHNKMKVLGLSPTTAETETKPRGSKRGKMGLVVEIDKDDEIRDAMREWAVNNQDKLQWLARERGIFYTITGCIPTQILEPLIDKETQELQNRDWHLENGEVKRKR